MINNIKNILRKIKWQWFVTLYYVFRIFPIKKNKIIFSNFCGKGYGDNPKYICEEILRRSKDYDLVWCVENSQKYLLDGVRTVKVGSIKHIFELCTAKVWIDNCRKQYVRKRKQQYYIQTWHGIALKRIEGDVSDKLSKEYIRNAKHDSKNIDLLLSDGRYMTSIYKKSFWYDGRIVEWGSPRNDILIDVNKRKNIRDKVLKIYAIDSSKRIVLYAPTFRVNKSLDVYSLDFDRVIHSCECKFGGKFVLFIRLHPNMKDEVFSISAFNSEIISVSQYPDVQELLVAADVVVTDYSSLMFDYAFTKKPCFQYAVDIDEYKKDRDFYIDLEKLPFSIATNNDEMEKNIAYFNQEIYEKQIDSFVSEYGLTAAGCASTMCANIIEEKCR